MNEITTKTMQIELYRNANNVAIKQTFLFHQRTIWFRRQIKHIDKNSLKIFAFVHVCPEFVAVKRSFFQRLLNIWDI